VVVSVIKPVGAVVAVAALSATLSAALLAAGVPVASTPALGLAVADTGHAAAQSDRIVDDDPASFTPHVMDGDVHTMARVGDLVLVGGSFTRVRNAGSQTDIPRRNLFAFHASTGQVSTTFAPDPDSTVYTLEAATDGTSAYVGGAFGTVRSGGASVAASRLYRVDVATGSRIAQFQPGTLNGQVRDVSVVGSHLWIAGKFTHVQGQARRALATVDATTGGRDPFYDRVLAGVHRAGSATNVQEIATSPDNDQLVAIGNFDTVDGVRRHQLAVLDISGPTAALADYRVPLFESACSSSFETYLTDVQFSPDGSFFVVSTTGAYGGYADSMAGTSGCDVVARFESGSSGAVAPTWTAYTGGDTTWTVEVTEDVVYAGGHQRWQNNPARGDAPDEGAVSRPGIAALDTANGLPYSWNPTRTLGAGVRDMLATPEGLFVGSDTDVFAGETRRRVAFLPLATGAVLPPRQAAQLPAELFRVAAGQSQLLRRSFDGNQVTASSDAPNGSGWGSAVGAFMANGDLYTAYASGTFTRRTFDGATYGPAVTVDAADQLVFQDDWHAVDLPRVTSLFYEAGWLYFTTSLSNQLYRRGFEPESGVVGQQRFAAPSVTGVNYLTMRGAFVAGGSLFFAATDGALRRADWGNHGAVGSTATVLTAAGGGWASRVMFPYQGPPITPPDDDPAVATFVGAASTAGNRTAHRVNVPGSVRAGDLLLLHFVANTTTPTYSGPPGWEQVEAAVAGSKAMGRLYRRTATAADAGSQVSVTSTGFAKSVLTVAAYRSDDGTVESTSAVATQATSGAQHVTPTVTATGSSSWLVSYWADKSGTTTAWSLPPGAVARSDASGTGSGHVSAVLADSAGPVPPGQRGGLTATADADGSAAITFTVLVTP
jgi:hypothetical protein